MSMRSFCNCGVLDMLETGHSSNLGDGQSASDYCAPWEAQEGHISKADPM